MAHRKRQSIIFLLALHYWYQKRKRSMYIREILKRRTAAGEMNLVKDMTNDPQYHFRYFRMSRENFVKILEIIGPKLAHHKTHAIPIGPEERLAITLRFLASGSSQVSLGFSYRMSPAAIGKILRETMQAIWSIMARQYVPVPTMESYMRTMRSYWNKWNFPNCLGSVDGKHVKIQCPAKTGSDFYNYKGYFSVVLIAIADANYKFSVVDIGAKGSQSDSGIFGNSTFGQQLYSGKLKLPADSPLPSTSDLVSCVFLGDEAFPLQKHLLRPYPGKNLTLEQRVFNYRMCRARRIVENTFGIWTARFRIFQGTIIANLDLADLIVKSTVVLHNYLMENKDMGELTFDSDSSRGSWRTITENDSGLANLVRCGSNNHSQIASDTREAFKNYFNSEAGSVDWQYDSFNYFQDMV